jgi:phage terminase large subunit GpA-like protein
MPLQQGAFTTEHAKQLVSERKVIERDSNGGIKAIRWDRVEGRRAEVLDCHNYARAGAELMGWSRMTEAHFVRFEQELAEAARAVIEEQSEAAHRKAKKPKEAVDTARTSVGVQKPRTPASAPPVITAPQAVGPRSNVTITSNAPAQRRVVPLPKAQRGD